MKLNTAGKVTVVLAMLCFLQRTVSTCAALTECLFSRLKWSCFATLALPWCLLNYIPRVYQCTKHMNEKKKTYLGLLDEISNVYFLQLTLRKINELKLR